MKGRNAFLRCAASDDAVLSRAALEGLLPFTRKHGLNERDDVGRTPAMVAAWLGATTALRVLAAGSNLDLQVHVVSCVSCVVAQRIVVASGLSSTTREMSSFIRGGV